MLKNADELTNSFWLFDKEPHNHLTYDTTNKKGGVIKHFSLGGV
jgi:hypothetical protein